MTAELRNGVEGRIAASPARDCGPSCPRSSADGEGLPWPSGAPVLKRGDATIPILSGRTLQLSTLDAPPAQRVRSIRTDHPLRTIRTLADDALASMDQAFADLYAALGRPSIGRCSCR